jgi:hypothetical protein
LGETNFIATNNAYDPFARRKTAPVHITSTHPDDLEFPSGENEISKDPSLSGPSAEVEESDNDDIFDSIDITVLENGILVLI